MLYGDQLAVFASIKFLKSTKHPYRNTMQDQDLRKGVLLMLAASFLFAVVGACARYLRDDFSTVQLVFFRNLIGIVFIISSLWRRPAVETGGKPFLLIFRGIAGTLALYAFFYGIAHIGLAEAITYQQTYPVFLALFSMLLLGERLYTKEWIAMAIGLIGIVLIFGAGISLEKGSVTSHSIGLLNAVLTALAYFSIKGLGKYYDTRTIVLSFMIAGLIFPSVSMLIGEYYTSDGWSFLTGRFIMPSGEQWLWLLILGLAALGGQVLMTKSFFHDRGGILGIVGYSNIGFSVLFGILLGDPFPDKYSWAGIILIVLAGGTIALKKKM